MQDITDVTLITVIGGTIISVIGSAAFLADKALERRHERRLAELAAGANASSPLYAQSSADYDAYPFSASPEMVMCGGCGEAIPAGSRPADHDCPALTQISLDLRV